MSDLKLQTAKGSMAMGLAILSSRPIDIVALAILARLLDPADFGVVALASVLFSTARLFSGLGMDSAVIQNQRPPQETAFFAFVVTCLTSLSLFLIINVRIDAFAMLLGNADLAPVLRWMSALLVFDAVSLIPEALLRRRLMFGKVSLALVVMHVADNLLAIALAFLGYGVWSLVWGRLIGSFARMVMMWTATSDRTWLVPTKPNWSLARELIRYGMKSTSGALVNFVNSNWDDWYVGRILGAAALGFYDKAYNLTNGTIVSLNTTILSGVFMPSYAQIQEDKPRVRRVYLKALGLSAMLMAPLSMGVFAVAPELTRTVFGEKWMPMVPALQVFAFMALIRPLAGSTSPLFRALGHPEYDLQGGLIVLGAMVPMVLYMARWGIAGVALAVTVSFAFGFVFNMFQLHRLLPGVVRKTPAAILPALVASAAMVLAVQAARSGLEDAWIGQRSWSMLLALTAVGGVVYVGVGYLLQRELIVEMLVIFGKVLKGNRLMAAVGRRSAAKA